MFVLSHLLLRTVASSPYSTKSLISAIATTKIITPLSRLQSLASSHSPDALEKAWDEFETTFKTSLNEKGTSPTFLSEFCGSKEDVALYSDLAMKIAFDMNRMDDLRMVFVKASEELKEKTPSFLYDLYFLAMCQSGSFNIDEVGNLLKLTETNGVPLGPVARVCILEVLTRSGIDCESLWASTKQVIMDRVQSLLSHTHKKWMNDTTLPKDNDINGNNNTSPVEEAYLLESKLVDLASVVTLTHYNNLWALELCDLCSSTILDAKKSKMVIKLVNLVIDNHEVNVTRLPHVFRAALKVPEMDVTEKMTNSMIKKCVYWHNEQVLEDLELILKELDLIPPERQDFINVSYAEIYTACGKIEKALEVIEDREISVVRLITSMNDAQEPSMAWKLAQTIARMGTDTIDKAFNFLKKRYKENGRKVTFRSLDILMASCAILKDSTRALEMLDSYNITFNEKLTSLPFYFILDSFNEEATAVDYHRRIIAEMLKLDIIPTPDTLRIMLEQCMAVGDMQAGMWIVKLHLVLKIPVVALSTFMKFMERVIATADREGAQFLLRTVEELHVPIQEDLVNEFKAVLDMVL